MFTKKNSEHFNILPFSSLLPYGYDSHFENLLSLSNEIDILVVFTGYHINIIILSLTCDLFLLSSLLPYGYDSHFENLETINHIYILA
jgi:hypothetical protein